MMLAKTACPVETPTLTENGFHFPGTFPNNSQIASVFSCVQCVRSSECKYSTGKCKGCLVSITLSYFDCFQTEE